MSAFESICRQTDGGTAVLFVHGIQGSPGQFQGLMDALPEQTACLSLLLPGHGRGLRAFCRANRREWQQAVTNAARSLCGHYARVLFVGHSMGCLLGLEAARQQGVRFQAMLLLACPFYIRPTFRYFRCNFLSALHLDSDDPFVRAAIAANSVPARNPAAYLLCARPYVNLFSLMRQARKAPPPSCPVTAFFMEQDEIVSPASLRFAREKLAVPAAVLPGCGHNYWPADARAVIADALLEAVQPSSPDSEASPD